MIIKIVLKIKIIIILIVVPRYLSPNGYEKLVTKYLKVLAINSPKLYDKFIYYNQV